MELSGLGVVAVNNKSDVFLSVLHLHLVKTKAGQSRTTAGDVIHWLRTLTYRKLNWSSSCGLGTCWNSIHKTLLILSAGFS